MGGVEYLPRTMLGNILLGGRVASLRSVTFAIIIALFLSAPVYSSDHATSGGKSIGRLEEKLEILKCLQADSDKKLAMLSEKLEGQAKISEELFKQAKEEVKKTDWFNLYVNIALAVLTGFVVIVALFQEVIARKWKKTKLGMEIKLRSPDSVMIVSSVVAPQSGTVHEIRLLYIRIKVVHEKGVAGESVEIMPLRFWSVTDGNAEPIDSFLPISLHWSYFPHDEFGTIRVPAGSFRYCDLGYFERRPDGKASLTIDTVFRSNPVGAGIIPNVFGPGEYQFELELTGDNVKATKGRWKIKFDAWIDDEGRMLESISIEKMRSILAR